MRLVSTTINRKTNLLIAVSLMISLGAFSQENSPYSRYGLGDLGTQRLYHQP